MRFGRGISPGLFTSTLYLSMFINQQVFTVYYNKKTISSDSETCTSKQSFGTAYSSIECLLKCKLMKLTAIIHNNECFCSECDMDEKMLGKEINHGEAFTFVPLVVLTEDSEERETLSTQDLPKSCKEMKSKGHIFKDGAYNDAVLLNIGGSAVNITCWFNSATETSCDIMSPGEWEYPKDYIVAPTKSASASNKLVYKLNFSNPDDIIESFKANRSCIHRIDVSLMNILHDGIQFRGWNGILKDINDVPQCAKCKTYKSNAKSFIATLAINDNSFIPVKELILSDLTDSSEHVEFINYYLQCCD